MVNKPISANVDALIASAMEAIRLISRDKRFDPPSRMLMLNTIQNCCNEALVSIIRDAVLQQGGPARP